MGSLEKGMTNKVRILILVDNARRDLMSCYLLKDEFIKLDCEVKFCSKRNYSFIFKYFAPDAFIVTRGDYPFLEEYSKNCKIFICPSEGGRLTPETMRSVFFGRFHDNKNFDQYGNVISDFRHICKVYLWGEMSKNLLDSEGYFQDSQIEVVGNPRLDVYKVDKQEATLKQESNNVIGVAVSVKSLSCAPAKPNYIELIHGFIDDEKKSMKFPMVPEGRHYEDYVWRDFAITRKLLTLIKRIIHETEATIKIRVGPFEDPSDYRFLTKIYPGRIIIQNESELLFDYINQIDCLLTCWSTTGLECVISNKPVIAFPFTLDRSHLSAHVNEEANGFNSFLQLYHLPTSDDECISTIKLALNASLPEVPDRELSKNFLKGFYNLPQETSSSSKIANDVLLNLNKTKKSNLFERFVNNLICNFLIFLSNLYYNSVDIIKGNSLEILQYQTKSKKLEISLGKRK